ncbi:MAG: hypothetical protein AAGH15_07270 [Myxococcota bacterium]
MSRPLDADGDLAGEALEAEVRRLAAKLLSPKRVATLSVRERGEVLRARLEEVIDDADDRHATWRIARKATFWAGPPGWVRLVEDGAASDDLPLAPVPLPESYREGRAIDRLPDGLAEQVKEELTVWTRESGGVEPKHRVTLWREDVVLAVASPFHLWIGLRSRHPLLVLRERTRRQIANGAAVTVLAGLGAGGFGLVVAPWLAAGAFAFGAGVAGSQVAEQLRKRYRPVWSWQRGDGLATEPPA